MEYLVQWHVKGEVNFGVVADTLEEAVQKAKEKAKKFCHPFDEKFEVSDYITEVVGVFESKSR